MVPTVMCAPQENYLVKEAGDYRFHVPDRLTKVKGKKSSFVDNRKATKCADTVEI